MSRGYKQQRGQLKHGRFELRRLAALVGAVAAAGCMVPTARAVERVWIADSDGFWNDDTKWLDGIFADIGDDAAFRVEITADRTVELDSPREIGRLLFEDTKASHNWILNGIDNLLITDRVISVINTTATINAQIIGQQIEKQGNGNLVLTNTSNLLSGPLFITGGTVTFEDGLALSGVSDVDMGANMLNYIGATASHIGDGSSPVPVFFGSGATFAVNHADGSLTLSGRMSGGSVFDPTTPAAIGTAFTKTGAGKLILSNGVSDPPEEANDFDGNIRVLQGTLSVPSLAALGKSNVIQASGRIAGLQLGDGTNPAGFEHTGPGSETLNMRVTLGANNPGASFHVDDAAGNLIIAQPVSGGLSGSAQPTNTSFTKTGAGTLTLAGANTFRGNIKVLGGTLAVSALSSFGNNNNDVQLDNATLRTIGTGTIDSNPVQYVGAQVLNVTAGGATIDVQNPLLVINDGPTAFPRLPTVTPVSQLQGNGNITKTGPGTLQVGRYNPANANQNTDGYGVSYNGAFTVNQGTLLVAHPEGAGRNPITITGTGVVSSSVPLQLNSGAPVPPVVNQIILAGGVAGSGLQSAGGVARPFAGAVVVNAPSFLTVGDTSVRLMGAVTANGNALTIDGPDSNTTAFVEFENLAGNALGAINVIDGGAVGIHADATRSSLGTGTVTLRPSGAGAATIGLRTDVDNAAFPSFAIDPLASGAVGVDFASSTGTASNKIIPLPIDLSNLPAGITQVNVGGRNGYQASVGAVNLGRDVAIGGPAGGHLLATGVISGTGRLVKNEGSTLELVNAGNTFSGGLTVNGGMVLLSGGLGARGTGATVVNGGTLNTNNGSLNAGDVVLNGGTIDVGTGTFNVVGNLNTTGQTGVHTNTARILGKVDLNGGERIINVNPSSAPIELEIGASISNGSIIKAGAGTLQLSGNGNTHTRNVVREGTLRVGATGAGSGDIVLDSSGAPNANGTLPTLALGALTYAPGLAEGRILSPSDFASVNPLNAGMRLEPRLAQSGTKNTALTVDPRAANWFDNETWVYSGQFFDADGKFSFAENIDDAVQLKIDGQVRLRNTIANNPTSTGSTSGLTNAAPPAVGVEVLDANPFGGTIDLGMGAKGDGWHDFELRISNATGPAGPVAENGWASTFGFGVNRDGTASALGTDHVKPIDPGDGTVFRGVSAFTPYQGNNKVVVKTNGAIDASNYLGSPMLQSVEIQDGATLSVKGAGVSVAIANLSGTGTIGIDNEADVRPGTINSTGLNRINKTGAGSFFFDNLVAGQTQSIDAILNIQQGQVVVVANADASINTVRGATLSLNGGELTVNGVVALQPNILEEIYYALPGAGDPNILPTIDPSANPNSLLARTPAGIRALDTRLNFTDDLGGRGPGTANNAVPFTTRLNIGGTQILPNTDNFGAIYRGVMNVGVNGLMPVGINSFGINADDGCVLYIDLDRDGTFETGELVVDNRGAHDLQARFGTANLTAGSYDFAVAYYEIGGEADIEVRFAAGSVAALGSMTEINPAAPAQAGIWAAAGQSSANFTSNDLRIVQSSAINVKANGARFGDARFSPGAILTTNGIGMEFASTTGEGAIGYNVTSGVVRSGRIVSTGTGITTFTKSGGGDLRADTTSAPSGLGANSTVVVSGGRMFVATDGVNNSLGLATVRMAGGALSVRNTNPANPADFSANDIHVVNNSTIDIEGTSAQFGDLTLDPDRGLTLNGPNTTFASTTGNGSVRLTSNADVTTGRVNGAITALNKVGTGNLFITHTASAGTGLSPASAINVNGGSLVVAAQGNVDAVNGATINLNGGGLIISANGGGGTVGSAVNVKRSSTISASPVGGSAGPQTANLGNAGSPITITGLDRTLTLTSSPGYTLGIGGALNVPESARVIVDPQGGAVAGGTAGGMNNGPMVFKAGTTDWSSAVLGSTNNTTRRENALYADWYNQLSPISDQNPVQAGDQRLNPIDAFLTVAPDETTLYTVAIAQLNDQTVQPASNGVITDDNFGTATPANGADNFMAGFRGIFNVTPERAGAYTFSSTSDDGSVVYIDLNNDNVFTANELLLNNDAFQAPTTVTGPATEIPAGSYRFLLAWAEGGGGSALSATVSGPTTGGAKTIDPRDPSLAGLFQVEIPGSAVEVESGASVKLGGIQNHEHVRVQGMLEAGHVRAKNAVVNGSLKIRSSGNGDRHDNGGTSVVEELTLGADGQLDLTNNGMIIDDTPLETIVAALKAGRNAPAGGVANGKWDGARGIMSSAAAARNGTSEVRSIGYAVNGATALVNFAEFMGQPTTEGEILLRYTYLGDANLDGVVSNNDITALAGGYRPGVLGKHWHNGDFNFDGEVNNNDITILAGNYRPTAEVLAPMAAGAAAGLAAVPEPGGALLLALSGSMLMRRRRKTI